MADEKKKPPKFDPSNPDSLRQLDQETLVSMFLNLHGQYVQLSELIQQYLREKYGSKDDRFIDSNQLSLFETEQKPAAEQQTDPDKRDQKSGKNKSHDRNPRPSTIPRVKIRARELCPEDLICKCCGKPRIIVNQIILHSRFDYKPSSVCIEDIVEDIYACPDCEGAVVSAAGLAESLSDKPTPAATAASLALVSEILKWVGTTCGADQFTEESNEQVIDDAVAQARAKMLRAVGQIARCQASAGMLSYVVVSKYCDHLPLYRLEQIFARHGANIARSTMCGWLAAVALLLRPLYDLMHEKLLDSKVIWTDDTPVKVLVRKLKKNIKTGRIWVYIGDENHPFNLFHYTPGRAREGPKKFLKGFRRYLQGDCFSGNEAICAENGATLVACNAHARRYFVKAILNYRKKSEEALRFFQQLFEIEKTAKELGLNSEQTKLMRAQEAMPILDQLKTWLDVEHLTALPKSAFGKAVAYCLNNWEALSAYLQDGDLTVDNNAAEREMKTVAIGRKAWMFFGSENGGENAEVLMSIISTCKRHSVEPWQYLRNVIETLVLNPDTNLEELLPHIWKNRRAPVASAA